MLGIGPKLHQLQNGLMKVRRANDILISRTNQEDAFVKRWYGMKEYHRVPDKSFSPYETGGRKEREISKCCRKSSQGSCSYFYFLLSCFLLDSAAETQRFQVSTRWAVVK